MKTYEIRGLKIISNLYHERLRERINKKIEAIVPYVFVGLVVWAAWMFQQLYALQFLAYQRVIIFN